MNWKIWSRKLHYSASFLIAIQVALITVTGSMLLLRKQLSWVEPKTMHGISHTPEISFPQVLAQLKSLNTAHVNGWSDISKVEALPKDGVIKVRTNDQLEVQLDAKTAEILHVQQRNTSLIAGIHTGKWFHPLLRYFVFLPTAILLFFMMVSGMIMAMTRLKNARKTSSGKSSNKVMRPS